MTIAGQAAAGTADSTSVDTSGSADYATIYATGGPALVIREGNNIDLAVDTDTMYINAVDSVGFADDVDVSGTNIAAALAGKQAAHAILTDISDGDIATDLTNTTKYQHFC
jgi:hypothetical protein